ncbi:MAG: trifunctional transcriptional regulator/proline dehydrogenase/L-glutamate gamma-semialdehyde dehydrogenase [Aquabacterium sp.]
MAMMPSSRPFQLLGQALRPSSPLRDAIDGATRRDEAACVQALLADATLTPDQQADTQDLAMDLAGRLRERKAHAGRDGLVQALMQEFSLSTQEGVSLMCLAEALLRIPDEATRDALIRDKIADADWAAHLGHSPSLFVNAATWGLLLTGKLVSTHGETGLSAALKRVAVKGGEPLIRKAVDVAMRMLGEQFVIGQRIDEALDTARSQEAQGFRHSYDMLGEAALTDADAQRYVSAYEEAIHAIGRHAAGRSLYEGPGISIKLSALHPRYSRAQYARVMDELYPRLLGLVRLAQRYNIGLNIDAEESERLALSLDLLERLCLEPSLHGWDGIGFVVQAYQKRCPFVLTWLIDLARRSGHRLMVRLVKGAYWDSEVKRAQVEGQSGYPVYTRKVHTDMAYLACARQLLAAPAEIFPQFATHNAHTLAAIYHLAGPGFQLGQYEFQCLHGMGEPLYEMVVADAEQGGLARPCRIYAPVGTHETLLAYLVRRLLENGANSSFVNRVADASIDLRALVADPVAQIRQAASHGEAPGAPHPAIALPARLFSPVRLNSTGLDLNSEHTLQALQQELARHAMYPFHAAPVLARGGIPDHGHAHPMRNPADRRDTVGHVRHATADEVDLAVQAGTSFAREWQRTPVSQRADVLDQAAELMQARMPMLMNLLVREAGKTLANALGEVREAIDFLRYNAAQARSDLKDGEHEALGPVVCISPWNFPLAIFTGQIAAALAAGNTVLAKPAEQTALIAAQAVAILHEAGVPRGALQLLPGPGDTIGAALVAHADVRGVMFTGSTQVARLLQAQLATRLDARQRPLPLIAETGGQNAMIVDSSALPEQVVSDVLASAFDSAGQRCSALRVLCLQDDIADTVTAMLRGAMNELQLGPTDHLHTDVGPLIDQDALHAIESHIDAMRQSGHAVFQPERALQAIAEIRTGCFVPPTVIDIQALSELKQEVFGPVLHVLRYQRDQLGALIDQINATGYGLTMGIHSRIDETIDFITRRAHVGNIYVNRNVIGAVVGVQPFGGGGLSGTGPKAGGPLYLHRLVKPAAASASKAASLKAMARQRTEHTPLAALQAMCDWLDKDVVPHADVLHHCCNWLMDHSPAGYAISLVGPTGERNTYRLKARQRVLCLARHQSDLLYQLATVLAVDAHALWRASPAREPLLLQLPPELRERIHTIDDIDAAAWDAVLMHGAADEVTAMNVRLARRDGPIVQMQALPTGWRQPGAFALTALFTEQCVSTNTAAAGGNASLMTLA